MKRHRLAFCLLAGVLAASTPPPALGGYHVVSLGSLPGGSISTGAAINSQGEAAGSAETPEGRTHAVRGDGGTPVDLMTLPGGQFSGGRGINDAGTVAGDSDFRTGQFSFTTHAFRMELGGEMEDLGVPIGARSSFATGINNGGQVSGYALMPGNVLRGFVCDGPGSFTEVGTFREGGNSFAAAINDAGQVVGAADLASGVYRAFVAGVGGELTDLGTLSGVGSSSFATAINRSGVVAGHAGDHGAFRAFRTRSDGSLQDLGMIAGSSSLVAAGINGRGDVVGSAGLGGGSSRAFLYTDSLGMVDLNALLDPGSGWVLTAAAAINDEGQVVGTGRYRGLTTAFRLDPTNRAVTPEPSAVVLSAIGLGAWLAFRRRR